MIIPKEPAGRFLTPDGVERCSIDYEYVWPPVVIEIEEACSPAIVVEIQERAATSDRFE